MFLTDAIPPAAHTSLHDCSLMLCLQVTLFTQQHFNLGLSVCSLGHSQQFKRRLFEPATIHMQWHSENLAKHAPPSFYCGDIVVLVIVLYCIMIATVSSLIRPVAGMTSHMTHRTVQLLSQAVCLYSLLISCGTSPLMHTHFYLQMTMSCSSWQNCCIACAWHSVLYLVPVLTVQKASSILPLNFKSKSLSLKALTSSHFAYCPTQHSSPCAPSLPLTE